MNGTEYPPQPTHVSNPAKLTSVSYKKVETIKNISVQAQLVNVWMKLFGKQVCKSVQWQEFMTNRFSLNSGTQLFKTNDVVS